MRSDARIGLFLLSYTHRIGFLLCIKHSLMGSVDSYTTTQSVHNSNLKSYYDITERMPILACVRASQNINNIQTKEKNVETELQFDPEHRFNIKHHQI